MAQKTVLITGATGQVGRALAEGFQGAGWRVLALSRSPGEGAPGQLPIAGDLSKEGESARIAAELSSRKLLPDALVNAARDPTHLQARPDGTVAREQWLGELTLDVVAAYELTMALANAAGSALHSVINLSSIYGMVSPKPFLYADPSHVPPIHYGVAKAALLHLTRDLAARLAPRGIAVNAVSFGGVEGRANAEFLARYGGQTPAGRMLKPAELAAPVQYLAGLEGSMLTGQNLVVDGGWTLW